MEILKKIAEQFADAMVLLKEAQNEQAITKLAEAVETLWEAETAIQEIEEKNTALETENAGLKEEIEVEKKAKSPKKPDNRDTMSKDEQDTWTKENSKDLKKIEAEEAIQKFVSMNLNADTMETMLKDLKSVSEVLGNMKETISKVDSLTEEIEKIKKMKNTSQQLEDEKITKTVDKRPSL